MLIQKINCDIDYGKIICYNKQEVIIMKKIICFILSVLMIFMISGCGNNKLAEESTAVATYNRLSLSPAEGFKFEKFEGNDSEGNKVDETIFEKYDLTLINCWTTWCPYCIQEMPSLNELYNELPENVNLISICHDAEEAPEEFKAIIEEIPHDFVVISAGEEFNSAIGAYNITGYPTTLFADKNGKIIGQIAGVPLSDNSREVDNTIKDGYKKLISDALEIINEK